MEENETNIKINKTNKVKNIIRWIVTIIFILFTIIYICNRDWIGTILFGIAAMLICPLIENKILKHFPKFPTKIKYVWISATLILFIIAMFFSYKNQVEESNHQFKELLLETGTNIYIREKYSEELCKDILEAWDDAIYSHKDFTDEVLKVIDSYKNSGLYDEFVECKTKIDVNMNNLSKKENSIYQNEYNKLLNLYDKYCDLYYISINPSGSYYAYSNDYNKFTKDFSNAYSQFKVAVPEIEEKVDETLKQIEAESNRLAKLLFKEETLLEHAKKIEDQIHSSFVEIFQRDFLLTFDSIIYGTDKTEGEVFVNYIFGDDKVDLTMIFDYDYNLQSIHISDYTERTEMGLDYFVLCCAICEVDEFGYNKIEKIHAQSQLTTPHEVEYCLIYVGKTSILSNYYIDRSEPHIFLGSISIKEEK